MRRTSAGAMRSFAAALTLAAGLAGAPAWSETQKAPEGAGTNVQLLKGMTAPQLQRTMNMMRGALGVHCDFCHVMEEGKGWDFTREDKRAKQTARRMIQMVMDLNRNSFDGQPRISCFTCHQGNRRPENLIGLPQAPPPLPTVVPARLPPDAPTPEQVLEKYTAALGGAEAIKHLTSRSITGTLTSWDNKTMPFEQVQAAPNLVFTQVTQPQGGTSQRGYDGKTGWVKGPRGVVQDIEGSALADVARGADFFGMLELRGRYTGLAIIDRKPLGSRQAWVLQGLGQDRRIERFYFDVETGLLLRHVGLTVTPIGLLPEQEDFDDYREVQGLRIPFQVTSSFVDPWIGQVRRYLEVRHNVEVDPSRFARPAPR